MIGRLWNLLRSRGLGTDKARQSTGAIILIFGIVIEHIMADVFDLSNGEILDELVPPIALEWLLALPFVDSLYFVDLETEIEHRDSHNFGLPLHANHCVEAVDRRGEKETEISK